MFKKRDVPRLRRVRSELTIEQILDWADRFHSRHGCWPSIRDSLVEDDLSTNWNAVNEALRQGFRDLPGGSSIAQLLAEKRGHRNRGRLAELTEGQILQWADEYFRRTKTWPRLTSGPIPDSGGETWKSVDRALNDKRTDAT